MFLYYIIRTYINKVRFAITFGEANLISDSYLIGDATELATAAELIMRCSASLRNEVFAALIMRCFTALRNEVRFATTFGEANLISDSYLIGEATDLCRRQTSFESRANKSKKPQILYPRLSWWGRLGSNQ